MQVGQMPVGELLLGLGCALIVNLHLPLMAADLRASLPVLSVLVPGVSEGREEPGF